MMIKMSVPTSDDELLRDSRFLRYCREVFGELPLEEAIYQFRSADTATKGVIRREFYKWLREKGLFEGVKAMGRSGEDIPMPV